MIKKQKERWRDLEEKRDDLATKRYSIFTRIKSKGEKKLNSYKLRLTQEIKKVQLNKYEGFPKLTKEPKHQMFIQKVTPKIYPSTTNYNIR